MVFENFLQLLEQGEVPPDDMALPDILRKYYGLEVTSSTSPIDLEENDYHQVELSPEDLGRFNALFQQLPGLVAVNSVSEAAKTAFEGTYRLTFPKGTNPAAKLMQKNNGAFAGTLVDKGKIVGLADLQKATAPSTIAQQAALSAFSLASVVTGQYFMAEINQKLETLETTVQDIMQFLEIDWRSKLKAQQQFLNETQKNIRLLIANPVQQQASLTTVQSIRCDALAAINSCHTHIEIAIGRMETANQKKSVDKKAAEKALGEAMIYIPQYWYALYQYSFAYLLEVLLSQNDAHEYLISVQQDLEMKCSEYEQYIHKCIDDTEKLIADGKAFEPLEAKIYGVLRTFCKTGDIVLSASSVVGLTPLWLGLQAARLPLEFLAEVAGSEKKKANDKSRTEQLEKFSQCINSCTDLMRIKAVGSSIQTMDKWANESQEMIFKDGKIYVKNPQL